ncbi:FadR/GntR family transcriptional regulator [Pacificoceanicola onchidii]|uniref:FadR/GntR family transcriptional regulator n=1 Tax=Pacificoceanicola onchidii TaxID=2562685 RepID=UPI0010A6726E|nr:FadR/GntR family transcriptional regulator [Pacificoceanicola onchidii]
MIVKAQGGDTLTEATTKALSARILGGEFAIGARLPSEAQLCTAYGVSRTVVREAVAALRADGLVEPRRGAGVFVVRDSLSVTVPFGEIDFDRLSSVIEVLELRTAIEVESARMAAIRRSGAQIEAIVEAARAVTAEGPADADFAFHVAIAEATNNPCFVEALKMFGPTAIPRKALEDKALSGTPQDYIAFIDEEHQRIVEALLDQDAEAAARAMRGHLEGAQKRYRRLLRAR